MPVLKITFLMSILAVKGLCQVNDRSGNNNMLPPGPSRISGHVVDQYGNPLNGATITVLYPDKKWRKEDTFYSNEWGRYEVSVFRYEQPYVKLQIKVQEKVCATLRYNDPGMGMNLGIGEKPVVCKVKSRRRKK